MPVNRGEPDRRQSFRHSAEKFYAAHFKRKRESGDDSPDNYKQCDRLVLEKNLSSDQQGKRNSPDEKRSRIRFVEMLEKKSSVLPKASMRAVNAEEFRQLRAREKKRNPAFE